MAVQIMCVHSTFCFAALFFLSASYGMQTPPSADCCNENTAARIQPAT
jgi:hypothetical protein